MTRSVWLDALTPKQAMLLGTIAKRLAERGFDVILTARNYDYTVAVLRNMGLSFLAIGGYSDTLTGKIIEESSRIKNIVETIGDRFDVAIAYPNPVAARVAFGLGKPYIALTDSPHSEFASRLSLPLAEYVVFSRCIPSAEIEQYVYRRKVKLVQYNGVDEVEWLRDAKPSPSYVKSLGLEPYTYVLARPPEIKASYYRYKHVRELFEHLLYRVLELGLKLLYLPRYADDALARQLQARKDVVIPPATQGVIGYHVAYYALAVITGGGTLAREAALLGTPGISLFPEELYVDTCLQRLGLPLIRCRETVECIERMLSCIKEPEKYRETSLAILRSFERPSEAVLKILSGDVA
uniref:DUF354 domain-containing protein n=1 Tax=Ignisphaera aggregans TaxID=334771 RepID=A0A7C2ZM02_9CREN